MLTFLNIALLAGLAAVAIPPLVHLFSRKKLDEVDWAAMQFLTVSQKTRRKVTFENILLMLLRMLTLAALAFALAGPVFTSTLFSKLGLSAGERDIVIIIDGSASMACKHDGVSASETAKVWVSEFLRTLRPGDRVCVYEARHNLRELQGTLSSDLDASRNALELLAPPGGTVDWPGCVQAAFSILDKSRPERDIVIVSDGQRYGWADETTTARWDLLSGHNKTGRPRIWVTNVASGRPADPLNFAFDPITAARGVASANREVRFRSALRVSGSGTRPPITSVKLEIDGRPFGDVPVEGSAGDAVRNISFSHRFVAGSHLVTLKAPPDDLPGDNRQDFALEVLPAVPVLLVDGNTGRRSEFLRDALAPQRDTSPAFLTRTIIATKFTAANMTQDVKGPNTPPRVLVLLNVPTLTALQNTAIEKFLTDGGAVLVAPGDKVDAASWNRVAFRAGQGWLPARLVEASAAAKADDTRPMLSSFIHPAVEVFKDPLPGGLHTALFPTRWKLDALAGTNGSTGSVIARFSDSEVFVVERGIGRGRVVMTAVPLDNSWETNLVTLPDFVRLSHELLYYLAGAKAAERNLAPGQPILFTPTPPEPPGSVTVQSPESPQRIVAVKAWPLTFDSTRDAGPYKLGTTSGRTFWYAVRADVQESVLTPSSKEDKQRIAAAVGGMQYVDLPSEIQTAKNAGPQPREIWWLVLMGVMGLLVFELWFAGRLAKQKEIQ
ncbi:hypothetical protein BH11PLA2_BH11PLA2_15080 [soil metagenome]